MSDAPSVGLPPLSKEELKNRRKMADRNKRNEQAKTAKIDPVFDAPAMRSSVSFGTPVRVHGSEDTEKLKNVLGDYQNVSAYITKSKHSHFIMGVERQPATPAPNKKGAQFPKLADGNNADTSRGRDRDSSISRHHPSEATNSITSAIREKTKASKTAPEAVGGTSEKVASGATDKVKSSNLTSQHPQANSGASSSNKASTNSDSSHTGSGSASSSKNSHRIEHQKPQPSSANNTSNSSKGHHSSNNQTKMSKPDDSNHSVSGGSGKKEEKTTPLSSAKPHNVTNREPLLQSLNQEFIGGQSQSKSDSQKVNSKPVSESSVNSERIDKSATKGVIDKGVKGVSVKSESNHSSNDPRSVLKEKEGNRTLNGARIKNRPKLQIPENVEDMLQEFTSGVPQPVTAIKTPSIKDIKFPFQDKTSLADRKPKELKHEGNDSNSQGSGSGRRRSIIMSPGVGRTLQGEDIEEKDTSSSSSGSEDEESGESSDEGPDKDDHDPHIDQHDTHKEPTVADVIVKTEPETKVAVVTSIPVPPAPTSHPVPAPRPTPAPDKTSQKMKTSHSASSDSSSSESGESSESGSDSDSEAERNPVKKQVPWSGNSGDMATPDSASLPARQWDLKSFLQKEQPAHIISLGAKPPSYEAPASDKSEDLDDVEKRAADQVISDENPPSNDQDIMSKRSMSADEFSPPAPIDKHPVLSPIKSPQAVKSPAKRSYPRMSASEKLQRANIESDSVVKLGNKYDCIKNRERKTSLSKTSPSVSDCDKSTTRKGRVRKQKQKVKQSQAYVSSMSESESEIDVVNSSLSSESVLSSPHKSLPVSQQKSHLSPSISGNSGTGCSNKPVNSSARRKESKREKLLKDKDSVKLKADCSSYVPVTLSHCDSSKKASAAASAAVKVSSETHHPMLSESHTDRSIDKILDSFHPSTKPLSPISSVPHIDHNLGHSQTDEHLKRAGLAVSTVNPFPLNGNISRINGKPAVLVKIDLNKLSNYMCLDRSSVNFLKPLKHDDISAAKHQKVNSAKSNLPHSKNRKSHIVLHDVVHDKPQVSKSLKSVTNRTSYNSSPSIANDKANISAKHSELVATKSERNTSDTQSSSLGVHVSVKKEVEIPEFDSLPEHEPVAASVPNPAADGQLSDNSGDSDSECSSTSAGSSCSSSDSDSDNECNDSSTKPVTHSPSTHKHAAANLSTQLLKSPVDVKKRKLDATRSEDLKRRKTATVRSPQKRTAADITHSESPASCVPGDGRQLAPVKRERRGSVSSQHSTNSNLSQASHSSSRHKRGKSGAASALVDAGLSCNTTPDLKPASSSSTPLSSSHPANLPAHDKSSPAPASHKYYGKFEAPEAVKPINGYLGTEYAHKPRAITGYSLLEHRHEDERLKSSDEYHRQAKKYKYQADDMEHCVRKHVLYLESALCFMESGLAMERDHMTTDASKMYKDTSQFVTHEYRQLHREASNTVSPDKPEQKLAVLCQRIQSLVYMKLYMLRKNETLKLKRVLDDNKSTAMSTSQPKPPSAPSPHQTNWNRSTGTPSPMSPTPSPANSVCSVGSVGSDQTPCKLSNGTGGQTHGQPPGSIVVAARIHSITQKYMANIHYLINSHTYWDQADENITVDIRDFFIQVDHECGPLTLHSNLQHLIRYVRQAIKDLNV